MPLTSPEEILRKYGQPIRKKIAVFNVGGVIPYTVYKTEIITHEGKELNELWNRDAHTVEISLNQPPVDQFTAMIHGLAHAHKCHFPTGKQNHEENTEWLASFCAWFIEEAKGQGLI